MVRKVERNVALAKIEYPKLNFYGFNQVSLSLKVKNERLICFFYSQLILYGMKSYASV